MVYNPLKNSLFLSIIFTCLGEIVFSMWPLVKNFSRVSASYCLCPLFIVFLLSACSGPAIVDTEKNNLPVKPSVVKPVIIKTEIKPVIEKQVVSPDVAIVLSDDIGIYKSVADALVEKLQGQSQVYVLTGNRQQDEALVDSIHSSDRDQIVAIGVRATKALSRVQNKPVVFSYVLNTREYLHDSQMKAVSALPGVQQLFRDWKAISPAIRKVAVISGPDLDTYMVNARKQAAVNQIELLHIVVSTDKEFLYRSKTLPTDVQGQWLIPDNRILSRKVLKELLTYNAKSGKQTVVFSPRLLDLGGLFYSRVSQQEITNRIYQRLLDSVGKSTVPGEPLLLLSDHEMGINPVVARQLGLDIPMAYRKYLHD